MIHAEEIVKIKKQVINIYMKHTGQEYQKLGKLRRELLEMERP